MWATFKTNIEYDTRLAEIKEYNNNNKWTKKGLSLSTVKFGIGWEGNQVSKVIIINN